MPSSPEQSTNGRFFRSPGPLPMPDVREGLLGPLASSRSKKTHAGTSLTRDHELRCDAVSQSPPSPPVRPRTCSRVQHHVSRQCDWPADAVKGGPYPGSSWIRDPQGCRSHFALLCTSHRQRETITEHPRQGRHHGRASNSTYTPRAPPVPRCRSLGSQQHCNGTRKPVIFLCFNLNLPPSLRHLHSFSSSLSGTETTPTLTMDQRNVPPYPDVDTVLEASELPGDQHHPAPQYDHTVPPAYPAKEPAYPPSTTGPHGPRTTGARAAAPIPDPSANSSTDSHERELRYSTKEGHIDAQHDYKMVKFAPGDPEDPKNWSKAYKWWCTMVVAVTCFVVAFASSVITADIGGMASEFGVSYEAGLVSISVFVVGFGIGPMIFAPLSEVFGRQVIYASTLLVAVIFIIPCAVAENYATLIVCRTIDGIAFSAPMTLVGGTLADMWRNEERGVPMAAFSAAPFIGPAIGPLVGGFLSDAAGWRWLYWIQLILSAVVWILITFTVPETYAPTLLARRAKKMRKEAGDSGYVTEQELDTRTFSSRLMVFLIRPFQLLFRELIVLLISLYMSVLYGLLYMFFVAYPIVFQKGKGYSAGITGLMFIPLALGVICAALCAPFVNRHYLKMVHKHHGNPPAEMRLIPMMLSCWFIPLGLFIFAWTSFERLTWVGPCLAGWPVGFGFIFLYNSANNYLVDSYQHQAASALAAKTFIRSFWGAGVVLFTEQMYERLNDQWATTLLAFLGLACCGIPFLFWVFGARIRASSKYAYSPETDNEVLPPIEGARPSHLDLEDLRRAQSYVSNP